MYSVLVRARFCVWVLLAFTVILTTLCVSAGVVLIALFVLILVLFVVISFSMIDAASNVIYTKF